MVGKRKFGCSHVHGVQDLEAALAHSCNVYFFHVGQLVTPPIIGAFAKAFGLNRRTGVDLPFEAKGKYSDESSGGQVMVYRRCFEFVHRPGVYADDPFAINGDDGGGCQ